MDAMRDRCAKRWLGRACLWYLATVSMHRRISGWALACKRAAFRRRSTSPHASSTVSQLSLRWDSITIVILLRQRGVSIEKWGLLREPQEMIPRIRYWMVYARGNVTPLLWSFSEYSQRTLPLCAVLLPTNPPDCARSRCLKSFGSENARKK